MEWRFWSFLKGRCLAFVSLERIRVRQRSRISYLREWDANTKFLHMKVNARRRKSTILPLQHDGNVAIAQDDMMNMVRSYYQGITGSHAPKDVGLDSEAIGLRPFELSGLEAPFTEEEVKKIIMEMPP